MDSVGLLRDVPTVHGRRRTSRTSGRSLVVAISGLFLGCLPAGSPPAGQHIIHDRTLSGVFFTASEALGVPSHLLATGPLRQPDDRIVMPNWGDLLADVYEFPVAAGAATKPGLLGSQPFARNLILQYGDVGRYTFATDSRGRPIYLTCESAPSDGSTCQFISVQRFDWTTESAKDVGQYDVKLHSQSGAGFLLSPSRDRLFAGRLVELDDWVDLGYVDPSQGAFIGEDFYYVSTPTGSNTGRASLGRSKPGAESEILLSSTGGLQLRAIQGDRTPQVLVSLRSSDWRYTPIGLLDTETKLLAELPAQARELVYISASSDGHWLLFQDYGQYTGPSMPLTISAVFAYDWTTGQTATLDSTTLGDTIIAYWMYWRPGHHDVWFSRSGKPSGLVVWRLDSASATDGSGLELDDEIPGKTGEYFYFTRDGRYWLTLGQNPVCVGFADDLSAPLLPLGMYAYLIQQMQDGRWLVGASTTDLQRQDISIIDPVTRTSRLIASGGHIVALGQTRALALLNWESTRQAGDLTLVDLATGAQTVLAEDVYAAAVDPGTYAEVPPDTDRLPPGTRMGFLMRSRLESPYDGLWVATLP
jgi:hypothetical protein